MESTELALVMGGGGARGAYQVGFLRHLARRRPDLEIPIVTGVSAGAINALHLASHPGTFQRSVEDLCGTWRGLRVEHVFRTDFGGLASNVLRWGLRLGMGGSPAAPRTRGMVDTRPLRASLERALALSGGGPDAIDQNIARGRLRAVAITTTSYGTGRSISWVQGRDLTTWHRPHRTSVQAKLTVDHAMASSSLPLFFPAIRIGDDWHGDGGVRLTAPLSPALHLGAGRILAVSTRYRRPADQRPAIDGYPPPAHVLGTLLNAVFLDMLDFDALNMERTNRLVRALPPAERGDLRPVRLFVLRPSVDLGRLASQYEPELPGLFRWLTRSAGTRETKSPDSLSMLMFQPDYVARLMELGERDAAELSDELDRFLDD